MAGTIMSDDAFRELPVFKVQTGVRLDTQILPFVNGYWVRFINPGEIGRKRRPGSCQTPHQPVQWGRLLIDCDAVGLLFARRKTWIVKVAFAPHLVRLAFLPWGRKLPGPRNMVAARFVWSGVSLTGQ